MNFSGEPHLSARTDRPAPAECVYRVAPEAWEEFIRWIDPLKDTAEARAALAELRRRQQLQAHSPAPLETRDESRRVAGAYMMLLGARVAALAGVRAIDNHTVSAVRLLDQLVDEVRAHGVVQVQAILDGTDSVATEIVQLAGFAPLAELLQLILPLRAAEHAPNEQTPNEQIPGEGLPQIELPGDLHWVPGREAPRDELIRLVAHTFIETLDCPALNGLRSPADVLEGFLDGQELSAQDGWWIMASQDKYLGCVLVNGLPNGTSELVYMGLGPTSRGRGYGRLLLEQGIATARARGSEMLVAAVDCANWPAGRLYKQAGFQENARVQAWFHRPGQ
jgi:ribosomal protein S18 acetylase RimI-like enzyme